MNQKITGILVIIAVVIVVGAALYAFDPGLVTSLEKKTQSAIGQYAFGVEIQDPSFKVVSINNKTLAAIGVNNYSYNSSHVSVSLPMNWSGQSGNYMFQLTNTLNYTVSINASDNFTNGAIFTYNVMKQGTYAYQSSGQTHNDTFAVMWQNNTTGKDSIQIVVAHNITQDSNFTKQSIPHRAGYSLINYAAVGDGLPVMNNTTIHIPANYYLYMGIGNYNWMLQQNNATASVSPFVNGTPSHSQKYVSGEITI